MSQSDKRRLIAKTNIFVLALILCCYQIITQVWHLKLVYTTFEDVPQKSIPLEFLAFEKADNTSTVTSDFTFSSVPNETNIAIADSVLNIIQNNARYKKPWMVLHIGPPKTATTSIQCGLEQYSQILKEKDNYYYLGIVCPSSKSSTMPNGEKSTAKLHAFSLENITRKMAIKNDTLLKKSNHYAFLANIESHYQQGHNIILSSELLATYLRAPSKIQIFKNKLEGFQIKVVMLYRHYVDWLPSEYYQYHVARKVNGNLHTFNEYLHGYLNLWDTEGLNSSKKLNDQSSLYSILNTFDIYSQYFDVGILNLHDKGEYGDIFQNFICQSIPDANHTCHYLTSQSIKRQDNELSKANIVTSKATKQGPIHARKGGNIYHLQVFGHLLDVDFMTLHNTTVDQGGVGKALYRSGIRSDPDYFDCINTTSLSVFRNVSYAVMEIVFEKSYGRPMSQVEYWKGKEQQDQLFEKNLVAGKYCDINVDKVLQNRTFISFLTE